MQTIETARSQEMENMVGIIAQGLHRNGEDDLQNVAGSASRFQEFLGILAAGFP